MLSVSTSESKIVKSTSNWVSYTFLWLITYQYLHYVMYWNPHKKTVKTNVKNHSHSSFDHSLLSSDKQETLESMKAWEDRSSCHCIPRNLNIVWHVETQSRAAATLPALFFSLHFTRKVQVPWCRSPGFIYHWPRELIQWEYIAESWSNPAVLYNTWQPVKHLFIKNILKE